MHPCTAGFNDGALCVRAAYPSKHPSEMPVYASHLCHEGEKGLQNGRREDVGRGGGNGCGVREEGGEGGGGTGVLLSVVVELEVAEDGEVGQEDDEGVKHYHTALDHE